MSYVIHEEFSITKHTLKYMEETRNVYLRKENNELYYRLGDRYYLVNEAIGGILYE